MSMYFPKKLLLFSFLSSFLSIFHPVISADPLTLKISHQFPGGSIDQGDFRDQLVRRFAKEVEKRTNGELAFEIYPDSSLMKTDTQFSALRKGALDLSLVPISYAGGEVPETNIGLMPGLVISYDQGYKWPDADVGKEFSRFLAEKGIIIVTWIWQAGGVASREAPIVNPEDAKGIKVRGGSRAMDLILKDAGAAVVSIPSDEIYAAMQTGAMEAAMTSSSSFISFRLEEIVKSLTAPKDYSYWFMLEPLMISKPVFDKLSKSQQEAIMQVGKDLQTFALESCRKDDALVAKVYAKAGAKVVILTEENVRKWQDIARRTAWKDFAAKTPESAKLLQLAETVK